ncbi:hypothetical protein BD626DRAFT_426787 [Schizophyllum amplum]|uniref:Uncharacterized protein n=1 Tax=Schizophyllum amplum TaxID=97359 RepID=A0A550CQG7_9AGAR|nr:hypothetical protein BD626DRAFT_426787 [Auriculariopsis ampla]
MDKSEKSPPQEQLESTFDRSASAVRSYAHKFEHSYGRQALDSGASFYNEHPALFAVVAVFLTLSLLPIATFIGFSLFIITSILLIALGCAACVIIAVELFLLFILISVLIIVAVFTFFVITSAAFTFAAFRLCQLAYRQGAAGLYQWINEVMSWISPSTTADAPIRLDATTTHEDSSEKSNGDIVLVDGEGRSREKNREVKLEDHYGT